MNIIFKEDTAQLFDQYWNSYILVNKIDFQYSLQVLNFNLQHSKRILNDKSFVVERNGECVGICFLPIESDNTTSVSIANGYVIKPLAKTEKIEKYIFSKIDEICLDIGVEKIKYSFSQFTESKFNTLSKFNFIDTSTSTCNIYLDKSKEVLWRDLRKSYKSLINSMIKNDKFKILFSNQENHIELNEKYVEFHKEHMKQAGKEPRSDNIYNKQLKLLENDLASIVAVTYKKQIVIVNYYFHNNESVSYSGSSFDTSDDFQKYPLNHFLLWNSILYFKKLGYGKLNFGQPCGYNKVNGLDDHLDDKQINISSFKRGMGAEMKTLYRGVKFINDDKFDIKIKELV